MESRNVRFHPEAEPINCNIELLPVEVIMEILSRVPTLDLEHLRYVCKRWRNILKNPLFRSLHSSHSLFNANDNKVLILKRSSEICLVDLRDKTSPRKITIGMSYVPDLTRYDIIGSCNGLLCLGSKCDRLVLVINPFTRQCEHLTLPPRVRWHYRGRILLWGFGFDSATKLFKVMVMYLRHRSGRRSTEVEVYDMGSGRILSCRNIVDRTFEFSSDVPGCFVNGRLHWTHKKYGSVGDIISFDLADEEFRLVPVPDCLGSWKYFDLFELGGSLCIFYCEAWAATRLIIWIMKEYGVQESWVKEFDARPPIPRSITCHSDKNQVKRLHLTSKGLGCIRDGEVLLKCKIGIFEEAMFSYDITSDKLELLELERLPTYRNGSILHTASLCWI